jgi:hypothetical protein
VIRAIKASRRSVVAPISNSDILSEELQEIIYFVFDRTLLGRSRQGTLTILQLRYLEEIQPNIVSDLNPSWPIPPVYDFRSDHTAGASMFIGHYWPNLA